MHMTLSLSSIVSPRNKIAQRKGLNFEENSTNLLLASVQR